MEWILENLKEDFEEKRKEIKRETKEFVEKWKKREDYLKDPLALKEILEEYEKLVGKGILNNKESYYFYLKLMLNESDPEIKARYNKSEDFLNEIMNEINFIEINISKIPERYQEEMLKNQSLSKYKHFLENLFKKGKYFLSENEEKIMDLKRRGAYSSWVDMLSGFLSYEEKEIIDENGEKITVNYSEIHNILKNKKSKMRDSALKAFNEIIKKYEDIAEAEINAILENKKINDLLRGYKEPDESRHIEDEIEAEVVNALIDAVSEKFEISKRFYQLKAKMLGFKKFKYEERQIEFDINFDKRTLEEDMDFVGKIFLKIDKEFYDIFNQISNEGNVDALPKKGKKYGAYCIHSGKLPTYILLNHSGKLRDLQTIAHEFGHGINNELMKKENNYLNIGSPKSTAEVASTFMEDFVISEFLEKSKGEAKLNLMLQKLQEEISTIIRQVACYKFERELHKEYRQKGYLSKKEIGVIFKKNMKEYLGESFLDDEEMEKGWIYWPHIREYFYVYSYASGLLISKALQRKYRDNPEYIKEIKKFLSAGTSKSPKEIFSEIGLDISKKSFWEEGLKEISKLLDKTEKLAQELGKI